MNVVLEGADGGGKSTLAAALGEALEMRVQQGSGPPKRPGEIERRTREYLQMRGTIFDRHPAVSQPIYGQLRGELITSDMASLVIDFYQTDTLFVYCRSTDASHHVVKAGESPEHVKTLTDNYQRLLQLYDQWALERARIVYRMGDPVDLVVDIVRVIAC